MRAKLVLHAKENITLDTYIAPKLENVQLPLEPIYENTITGSPVQSERERLARNAQLQMNCENRCKKQLEMRVMRSDTPGKRADLSLGIEGSRNTCSRNPHLKMDTLTTVELWKIMEDTFIRRRNNTFDRYTLFITQQSNGQLTEHFFAKINKVSENCELVNQEIKMIIDLFIAHMQDSEIQKELLKETIEPSHVLRLAIKIELGQWNHKFRAINPLFK